MVGGKLIEIRQMRLRETGRDVVRLWVTSTDPINYPGECAVYTEPGIDLPPIGDTIWWQSGTIYCRSFVIRG